MSSRGHEVTVFSACSAQRRALPTETVPLDGSNRTFKFALKLRHVDWREFDVLHAHGDDYWLFRAHGECTCAHCTAAA